MKNSIKIELVRKLVTAFIIVLQAVFLLVPLVTLNAEEIGKESDPSFKCLSAGYSTREECIIFFDKNIIRDECEKEGLSRESECKKFMFAKYSSENLILNSNFLSACKKAGAPDEQSCKELLKRIYYPEQCLEKGIIQTEKCFSCLEKNDFSGDCNMVTSTIKEKKQIQKIPGFYLIISLMILTICILFVFFIFTFNKNFLHFLYRIVDLKFIQTGIQFKREVSLWGNINPKITTK